MLFDGEDITAAQGRGRSRALGIVHAPEGRSVFGSLTVEENLDARLPAQPSAASGVAEGLERAYELFPRLGERRRQVAGTLSGGEQRMLSLARVLVEPPRLLVVDELSLGLAPIVVDEVYATLRRVHEAGTTLLHRRAVRRPHALARATRSCCSSTARWCTTAASPSAVTSPSASWRSRRADRRTTPSTRPSRRIR